MTEYPDVTPRPGNDAPVPSDPNASPDQTATGRLARRSATARRTMLKAAGALTLVGGGSAVLAACASGDTGTPAASSAAPSSAASSPSAAASSSSTPSATKSSASAKAPSGPSVDESSVPEGGGVIMEDADFVVTQPSKGEFKAFSKKCTHQGCAVSEITTTIDCKCHGSKFSITDGSVVNGPANEPLAESQTTVSGNKVYVEA